MRSASIDRVFERRLASLVNSGEPQILQGGAKGVEKESLRVTPEGHLAHTPHPAALGSALTSEHITTDFSESLIELVTPAFTQTWELLQYLLDLHQFVYRHLGEELLWATSMPCAIDGDADIPLAQYGSSHVGRMKTVYRNGLGLRYGRMMQAISGVHFNYSFPLPFWEAHAALRGERSPGNELISASYFDLLRNYRRHGWLVLYLFGVSPVVCKSFLRGRDFKLQEFGMGTAYEPDATSLRMSDVGYRNRTQAGLEVSVNDLGEYVRDLQRAISTPHPPYEALGVKVNGEWRQLNANILQIENEYYGFSGPERVALLQQQNAGFEQLEASGAWPVRRNWNMFAREVYSLRDHEALERFAGFEYRACCWRLRLGARRYVSSFTGSRDTGIWLQLELAGLAGVGSASDTSLSEEIRGYTPADASAQKIKAP